MDNLIYILFICIVAPLLLMLPLLKKWSRLITGYMIIGIVLALFVSEINTLLLRTLECDTSYFTTTITPATEEIVKTVPILFYALTFSDKRERLMSIALATGIGFGLFENTVVLVQSLVQSTDSVTIGWALIRGFSTALMHGVCTMTVGFGISFVKMKKKLFYCGTFALLTMALVYHGIYNMLVQSNFRWFGFVLPAITYIPIILQQYNFLKIKNTKTYLNLSKEKQL